MVWSEGFIANPSFSPDGKSILYEVGSNNQNTRHSWLVRVNVKRNYSGNDSIESVLQNQIKPSGQESSSDFSQPGWSPDAKHIVATGGFFGLAGGDRQEIWTMNADGSQAHRITKNDRWEELPVWSPIGDQIACLRRFTDKDGYYTAMNGADIFIMRSDGTGEKRLTHNEDSARKGHARDYANNILKPCFGSNKQIAFTQDGQICLLAFGNQNITALGDGNLVQWNK